MKQLTEYNRVSGYLNKVFDLLNHRYFEGALTRPVITIQNTPKCYGHVSVGEVWQSGEKNRRELNIGAGTIHRPIEEVVATMLHEMVHIYCMDNGIKDTSRSGVYHNKKFKEEAEKRDLKIEHSDTYGWTITSPTDALIEFCMENDFEEIKVHRIGFPLVAFPPIGKAGAPTPTTSIGKTKRPSSTRKYVCRSCGISCRATKDIRIACVDCDEIMEKVID